MADWSQEQDRIFDHEYDGIREYDNPMPRWWVWLFVLTVVIAFPYILYYHFGSGLSIHDQLDAEIAAYAEQLMATYGDLEPTEATLVEYMNNDVAMTGMAGLFKGKCSQCHLADGSGNVGPNLTDDSWLHVDQITDIPEVLKNGVVTKGMPAWGDRLTETEIVLLSSYVARLRKNPLPGKAPEGETIEEWPAPPSASPETGGASSG